MLCRGWEGTEPTSRREVTVRCGQRRREGSMEAVRCEIRTGPWQCGPII